MQPAALFGWRAGVVLFHEGAATSCLVPGGTGGRVRGVGERDLVHIWWVPSVTLTPGYIAAGVQDMAMASE